MRGGSLDHRVLCSCKKPALFTGFFLLTIKPVLYHGLLVIAPQIQIMDLPEGCHFTSEGKQA